ncbi:hypothetical protein F2Q69_00046649 [Brassica cretica]|uniref:Uncharacterized protein n=1 Tax=Brassica cretica TaxID=69181 RepID=A0A8S9PQR2_BRACR|nr:hypothetical protein F2Q69_00046649 [Brassica cretica]
MLLNPPLMVSFQLPFLLLESLQSPVPSRKPHVVVSVATSHRNPAEIELLFRLIHFWEARNIEKGRTFIGLELLQYEEQTGSGSTLMTISKISGLISTLVKGQSLIDCSVLDEVELATCVVFLGHLQSKEGPVKKIYFWDHAAKDFYKKFTSSENNPTVLCQFCSNPMIANLVNAEEVTKAETKTIRQIFLTSSWNPLTPANVVSASSNGCGFIADERNGSGSAIDESQKANRAKHGK